MKKVLWDAYKDHV